MNLVVNGQPRRFDTLADGCSVALLVASLGMQSDRVALELNGSIIARNAWADCPVRDGDRLEIVHFVGGGTQGTS
jgi:sulfur carrier protein